MKSFGVFLSLQKQSKNAAWKSRGIQNARSEKVHSQKVTVLTTFSHVTTAVGFVSNVKNRFYGNKWAKNGAEKNQRKMKTQT